MGDKPIYLWPFIIMYKIVIFILKLPIMFIHYMLLGLFFSFYFLFDTLITLGMYISVIWFKIISSPFKLVKKLSKKKKQEIKKVEPVKEEIKSVPKPVEQPAVKVNPQPVVETLSKHETKKLEKEKKRLAKIAEAKKQKDLEEQKKLEEPKQLSKREIKKLEKEKKRLAKLEEKKKEKELELQKQQELEAQKKLTKEEQEKLKAENLIKAKEIKAQMMAARSHTLAANAKNEGVISEKLYDKDKAAKELKEAKKKEKEEKKKKKLERPKEEEYINDKVKLEKKTFGQKFNEGFEKFIKSPKSLTKRLQEKIKNNSLAKNKRNEESMQREALLINFTGADAEKSDKKIPYEYVAKDPDGKIVKEYFEAFSKVEVHSYLLSEGYEVYSIKTNKWIQFVHANNQVSHTKMKTKDLLFFLAQLSTYIKAGIPLVEALRILGRQFSKNRKYNKLFSAMIYDLTMGDNFSEAMSKQGDAFPRILVNMVKASEMTGELPETLDDMYEYFTEADKTRKQMITAMTYPMIILTLAVAALGFIMVYIVPKFTAIYESMDNAELPGITIAITNFSHFLQQKWLLVLGVIAGVILIFMYLYKNVKLFRTLIQYALMHTPVVKNIIIYNEVTMFTKTFASLLKHNVFITDTMEILNKITNNEIWKMIILDTITNLAKGEKISKSFEDHWAVPMPAYEMIVTGERTGQLPEMMQKVSEYYQELHKNAVGRIKSFIEPILILFLTGVVGVIVLSIVIPMFSMYDSIQ